MPGEVEHDLLVALGLARTTLSRHANALVAAGAAHLHEGSLGDGVEVRRTLVEVLTEGGGAECGCRTLIKKGVGGCSVGYEATVEIATWVAPGLQASLLCKAIYGRLAVEPLDHLERVDGHEYPAGERVDLVLGEAYPRVAQDGGLVEVSQPGVISEPDLACGSRRGGRSVRGLGLNN